MANFPKDSSQPLIEKEVEQFHLAEFQTNTLTKKWSILHVVTSIVTTSTRLTQPLFMC